MARLVIFVLIFCILPMTVLAQSRRGDRVTGAEFATRSPVLALNGMAATSHPLATQIAVDVLKRGGSAVDAAIAANAALGFMEPASCGIGGDLFAIVWDPATERLYGLNASGRSPRGLSAEQLRSDLGDRESIPLHGPLSVSVPGAVDGWFELHERFGRLSMREVLEPTIDYARRGVPVPQVIAHHWAEAVARLEENMDQITDFGGYRRTFMIDGRAPSEGEIFRNPDLAQTYELIADGGREAYYRGPIAATIDQYGRRVGMHLRAEDFASHESTWIDPVSVSYRGYDVFQLPPNGQGIAVLQMLNILEGYDMQDLGHNSADYLHVLVEAKKLAFEDRAHFYADPAFYDIPLERLLSKEYAAERRSLIDMERALERIDVNAPGMQHGNTVYLAVADADGMMVSLIQSNFLDFGSGMVPDGLGFALQSRGAAFHLDPEHPNAYAPAKRPFHTIIPGFVMKDGEPLLSFGVMGGAVQPQGHVQVLLNLIDFGMNLQEAGDAARYSHAGSSEPTGYLMNDGGRLALESGIAQEVRDELERRGHHLIPTEFFGGYQAVMRDPDSEIYLGATEMRKDGAAAGY